MTHKVIMINNHDDENISDIVYQTNMSKLDSIKLANRLNEDCTDNSDWYYKSVLIDYKLYKAPIHT